MNCERCGKRPGKVTYTEYAEGRVEKLVICAECATELGFGAKPPDPAAPPPAGKLLGVVSLEAAVAGVAPAAASDGRRCPGCGLTAPEFAQQSLFGCSVCYETFDEDLDLLLKRLHGAVLHRGRLPAGRAAPFPPGTERLRRELEEAIREGDFERAARLRDRLRRAQRGPSREAGGPPPGTGR